ncbi:MAG: homoserine dehydrogenase [Spirochaetota bacterium]|nr:homoserine dehydrogenase [Spirochaetota bacterium]
MKIVNVGLIGFGTIGSGVYQLLESNRYLLSKRSGIDVRLKAICDLRKEEIRRDVKDIQITDDWKDIISNKEIDTVVELIGGIEPAKSIILESLKNNKNVVTANKKLLAEDGNEIFDIAGKCGCQLGFEASVGGGIPCIISLKNGLVANRVMGIMGILNGTCNYILSRMEDDGLPFDAALKDAQRMGFAEADPTFDIEGFDSGHKIAILSMLAYNKRIDYNSISIEGITKIKEIDIAYAKEMGYVIRLLGLSRLEAGDEVDIRVHPTMLPFKHPLASVRSEYNAVMFIGDMTGPVSLYGKGAGGLPTASAVVSDIIQIAQGGIGSAAAINISKDLKYLSFQKRVSRYYMRLNTLDRPGILSKISGVLARNNISIASVIQKAIDTRYVPLVIMTHKAPEEGIMLSVKEINDFDFIDGSVTLIRVEDSFSVGDSDEQ